MSHNRALYKAIGEKAKATWIEPADLAYDEWMSAWELHWLDTGKKWRDELSENDQMKKQLTRIIEFFEKVYDERTGQSGNATDTKVDG